MTQAVLLVLALRSALLALNQPSYGTENASLNVLPTPGLQTDTAFIALTTAKSALANKPVLNAKLTSY